MHKNSLIRKCLVVGCILSFLVTCLIPVTAQNIEKTSLPTSSRNWLYGARSVSKNYTTIQSVIDADTAIVHIIKGYIPPYIPNNPCPKDYAVDVPINTDLSWTGGDPDVADTVTYDVYFGSMSPLEKIANNISITSYDPGILADDLPYMWSIVAWDNHGLSSVGPTWHFITSNTTNFPPNKPSKPTGQINGIIGYEYSYTTSTIDIDGNQMVYYLWDWGDGNYSGWIGPYNSGLMCSTKHTWNIKGNFSIKVKAKDIHDFESDWSDPLPITVPYSFNKPILQFFEWLFQQFPNTFPILRYLLG
jgi:hypothetical protein